MTQYEISTNELILRVKKSPFIIRIIMFVFSFICFLAPILGMISAMNFGYEFHIGYLISIGIFSLIGFYMLRISLWNTYGSESLIFNGSEVTYKADYGWFKDAVKKENINPLNFSIKPIGYEEDNLGVLIIGSDDSRIDCVTKMPVSEIEELIKKLKSR